LFLPGGTLRLRKGLTLTEIVYIIAIVWMIFNILAIATELFVAWNKISHGDYNVTIPISISATVPLA